MDGISMKKAVYTEAARQVIAVLGSNTPTHVLKDVVGELILALAEDILGGDVVTSHWKEKEGKHDQSRTDD